MLRVQVGAHGECGALRDKGCARLPDARAQGGEPGALVDRMLAPEGMEQFIQERTTIREAAEPYREPARLTRT